MIKIEHLDVYQEGELLIQDLSLNCDVGEIFLLVGPNGSGKSTLLKEIFKASILNNANINIEMDKAFYSGDEFPQSFSGFGVHQYFNAYFDDVHGEDWYETKKVDINKLGVSDSLYRSNISDISGGEKRLINLIVALYADFDAIFMDEPESSVSERLLIKMMDIINKMKKEKLMVIATHNQTVLNKIHFDQVRLFENHTLKDVTPILKKDKSLWNVFKGEKGVIDVNFEF